MRQHLMAIGSVVMEYGLNNDKQERNMTINHVPFLFFETMVKIFGIILTICAYYIK